MIAVDATNINLEISALGGLIINQVVDYQTNEELIEFIIRIYNVEIGPSTTEKAKEAIQKYRNVVPMPTNGFKDADIQDN